MYAVHTLVYTRTREQVASVLRTDELFTPMQQHQQQQQQRFVDLSGSIGTVADACKVSWLAADERIVRRRLLLYRDCFQ